ncbi:nuclear distribution protein pac-1a, partial [Colletotrichum orchidophilum]
NDNISIENPAFLCYVFLESPLPSFLLLCIPRCFLGDITMSQILTTRQAEELHKAIFAYFSSINLPHGASVLRGELQIGDNFDAALSGKYEGSEDCTIKIWDWELGELERTMKGHTKAVTDVDFGGPRGAILLASCSNDLTIKLWDPSDDYKNIRTLPGHDHSVSAVRFISSGSAGNPGSGNLLVSASRDKTLRIWDVATGYCVKTLQGHTDWIRDVYPSPDGRFLLSAGDDRTGRVWDISTANLEAKVTLIHHEHVVTCCTFAPPNAHVHMAKLAGLRKPPAKNAAEFMATGSRDRTICLWDARGNCIKVLTGHDNWVRAVVFHPGGRHLLSVSDDKTLRCWDLAEEGRCVQLDDAHTQFVSCLRWAPCISREVATDSDAQDANNST